MPPRRCAIRPAIRPCESSLRTSTPNAHLFPAFFFVAPRQQEERDASSEFASAFFRASDATAAADAVSGAPVTRRIASVFRDAEVCTQKQKTAAKRVADAAKKREAAERTLRLAEAAARLADDAFDPVAAARDAAATVSGRLSPFQAVVEARREDDVTKSEGRLPTLLERRSVEESSPQSDASECDAPPKKKPAAIPLSPVAPAAGAKHRSWTPERKAEEARAEANALADMLRAAVIK